MGRTSTRAGASLSSVSGRRLVPTMLPVSRLANGYIVEKFTTYTEGSLIPVENPRITPNTIIVTIFAAF